MKLSNYVRALALLVFAALVPAGAMAQSVVQLPVLVKARGFYDFGNGPLKLRMVQGSMAVFTSQGSGTGTASASTALTLTATPATPPIVGGNITCALPSASCNIPANTTVTAYNGTTGITLSASSTVTAQVVNWGAACPTTNLNAPQQVQIQAGAGNPDLVLYTAGRICGAGHLGPDGIVMPFATSIN